MNIMFNSSSWQFIKYIFTDVVGFCYFVLPVASAFAAQLLLCLRARRGIIKAIPLLTGIFVAALSLLLRLILGIDYGFELAFPLGVGLLILLGSLAGWAVCGLVRLAKWLLAGARSRGGKVFYK